MSKIIDPADEQALKAAAGQPHTMVFVDKILKAGTDGYIVQVTMGWKTPGDVYAPVATLSMPAPFAKKLSDQLIELLKQAGQLRE